MKKEKITLIIGFAVGLLAAVLYCHFFAPRYEIKNEGLTMIKIDKWTGQSWRFADNEWKGMSDINQNWEEIDRALTESINIPVAQVDSTSALKRLRDAHPVLNEITDDELLERIKLVYSKMVLVNMYLGEYLKSNEQTSSSQGSAVAVE